jgi:hypothetical protein
MLETRGIATVAIASVLPQVEKTRPPRALMVPFMLGRPFGEPNDIDFQQRVLRQALGLIDGPAGPVILAHFPDDNPSWLDRAGWRASADLPAPAAPDSPAAWEAGLRDELVAVRPAWERFTQRFQRTTVGLSGLDPADWPAFAASFLAGGLPVLPLHGTPALSLRFVVDDLKALYGEAAQADGGPPSARQIDRWFWGETLAGRFLRALRIAALESSDNGVKTVGGRFFVPAPHLSADGG